MPLVLHQNAVQPLAVTHNPHFGQQMQYQNNAYNQYNPYQPHIPVQQMSEQHIPAQPMPAQQMPPQQMPAQQMPAQQMPAQQMSAQEMPINMTASAVTATPVNDPPAYHIGSTEELEATETEQKTITSENEQNSENRAIVPEAGTEANVTVPVEDTSSQMTMEANTNV